MSAEKLRHAAAAMREQNDAGRGYMDDTFRAVADWLDSIAAAWEDSAERFRPGGTHGSIGTWHVPEHHPALAVATAYLGADPSPP